MTDVTDRDRQLEDARRELMRRRLAERGIATGTVEQPETGGLSDGQRRMWFVGQADPSGALLNVCVSYRITGPVDLDRLHRAMDTVVRRHAALRTTYRTDANGEPQPVVHDELAAGWAVHDLTDLDGTEAERQAQRLRLEVLAQRQFGAPFDLTADAPLRISVLRTAPDELIILLVAHHIAWDDGCWAVFFTDLTRAYTGAPLGPPTRPTEDAPTDAQREDDLSYWRAVMSDPPEPLELPGPSGSLVPTTWRSATTTRHLSAWTTARVAELARATGATPYMVLLAAFGATVFRYTHTGDFLVATPVVNRGASAEARQLLADDDGVGGLVLVVELQVDVHRARQRNRRREVRDARHRLAAAAVGRRQCHRRRGQRALQRLAILGLAVADLLHADFIGGV